MESSNPENKYSELSINLKIEAKADQQPIQIITEVLTIARGLQAPVYLATEFGTIPISPYSLLDDLVTIYNLMAENKTLEHDISEQGNLIQRLHKQLEVE